MQGTPLLVAATARCGDADAQQRSLALAQEATTKGEEARRNLPLAETSLKRLEQETARLQAALAALDGAPP